MEHVNGSATLIGHKIRQLRLEKNMSIRALAEKSQVSAAYISRIERDLTEPSLHTLRMIAVALETRTILLMKVAMSPDTIYFTSEQSRQPTKSSTHQALIESLSPPPPDTPEEDKPHLSAARITLERNDPAGYPAQHPSPAFYLVLRGMVCCTTDAGCHTLEKGDTIIINRDTAHRLAAAGDDTSQVLLVLDHSAE